MKNLHSIKDILAWTECHTPLSFDDGKAECGLCIRDFCVVNDVPVLFRQKSQPIAHEGQEAYAGPNSSSLKNRIKRFLPLPNFIVARPTLHDRLRDTHVFGAPPDSVILNLGSGVQNRLWHPGLINLDIYPHENADVAGDAHNIPFIDGCMDGVWLCAVMEHLRRPFDVGNEVYRLLKPGGFVLVTVPFIQPRHGSPNDYFRYTLDGLRSVFKDFQEIEGGQTGKGPIGTWAELTIGLAIELTSRPSISYALRFLVGWFLYPIVLFDKIRFFRSKHSTISGGVCFFGCKPELM